jgi:hypothetical protein
MDKVRLSDLVALTGAPFRLEHTGGGHTAWMWESGECEVLVTAHDEAVAPTAFPVTVGFYDWSHPDNVVMTVTAQRWGEVVDFVRSVRSRMP